MPLLQENYSTETTQYSTLCVVSYKVAVAISRSDYMAETTALWCFSPLHPIVVIVHPSCREAIIQCDPVSVALKCDQGVSLEYHDDMSNANLDYRPISCLYIAHAS